MLHKGYYCRKEKQERLLARPNEPAECYNGIFTRWKNPVLTRDHIPLHWKYDLDVRSNPYFMECLGVNAVFNSGAVVRAGGDVFLYYASSDTRLHVASTTMNLLREAGEI